MPRTRKLLAALFALLGALITWWPTPPGTEVAVTTRALPPGIPLTEADVETRHVPPGLSPADAATKSTAIGRTLTSRAGPGEYLTTTRLTPPNPTRTSVAVRLQDKAITTLLKPGDKVNVVTPEATILAEDATVVAIKDDDTLAILSTTKQTATTLAAQSLTTPLALTLN
ncbi:SAF domain-containing protein [Actinosynnema sp. NPDC020468]|uniref:SAF domain-containing protein n=1 Tax=Actinosynnema sp. NPDC020468 TaxID=3154488 RepID=UPI003406FFFF